MRVLLLVCAVALLWWTRLFTRWPQVFFMTGASMEPAVVPADSLFLLADTRDIMGWPDSRFVGPIPVERIEARATRMVWPRLLRKAE